MPCSTFTIDPAVGPLIDIGIASPASLRQAGAPAPPIHWIVALADTGCSHTAIFTGMAAAVGLPLIGKIPVNSTTQTVSANVYLGDLTLRYMIFNNSFEFTFPDRQLTELIQNSPSFDSLLGMDILGIGAFIVNGQTRQATFCW